MSKYSKRWIKDKFQQINKRDTWHKEQKTQSLKTKWNNYNEGLKVSTQQDSVNVFFSNKIFKWKNPLLEQKHLIGLFLKRIKSFSRVFA